MAIATIRLNHTPGACSLFFASVMEKLRQVKRVVKADIDAFKKDSTPGKISILIADDDEDDREFFTEVVREIDPVIEVVVAASGEKLMRTLTVPDAPLPDILFLDLNMPGKDGKQCLHEIRSHSGLKNIPVVIYSTSALLQDIKDTHFQGANLYLRKPDSYNSAITLIKKVFSMDLEKMPGQQDIKSFVLLS